LADGWVSLETGYIMIMQHKDQSKRHWKQRNTVSDKCGISLIT
jgi:hypothetical protein